MTKKIERFEDLDVWQNSVELSINIYRVFGNCMDYSFKNQICRAAVSIASNIAEGFERQYNKEYIQYLFIAKGSSGELRTQLFIASKLNFLTEEMYSDLTQNVLKISAQLYQLIKTRKDKFY